MFHSARIQITAWYLLIIMIISLSFSLIIYNRVNGDLQRLELARNLREQRIRQTYQDLGFLGNVPTYEDDSLIEARKHLIINLGLINTGIILISALASYFLAGLTLKPISDMLENQKRFIADASHEIRTPLTALKSSIEVNLKDKSLKINDAKKLLLENLEEVDKLETLTNGLLQLSKSQKISKADFTLVSLKDAASEAIKKVEPIAKQKEIKIRNHIADTQIWADFDSIVKLFTITLENAIKYSPSRKSINLNSIKKDSKAVISIKDQGIGIAKEDLPHIFDRFYRAEKSRSKENYQGYGLGLAIAKQIVSDHHGTISTSSEIAKGTTFTIELPLKLKKF